MNAAVKSIPERVYRLSDEEIAAIEAARRSGLVSNNEVAAFWSRYGIRFDLPHITPPQH